MLKSKNSHIFIPDYWPLFQTREKRVFKYSCPDGTEISFNSEFSCDFTKNSMRYESYDENASWLNTWFYQHRPGFGIAEWRDDHPLDGWRRNIFGAKDRHIFLNPIGWGEYATIGGTYVNRPVKNTLLCWPPMFAVGEQQIYFEAFLDDFSTYHGVDYTDVLVFKYRQRFGGRSSGARYYNARGIGPVAIEWIHYKDDGTEHVKTRVDAVVEISENQI
jgi:hypothetical protein